MIATHADVARVTGSESAESLHLDPHASRIRVSSCVIRCQMASSLLAALKQARPTRLSAFANAGRCGSSSITASSAAEADRRDPEARLRTLDRGVEGSDVLEVMQSMIFKTRVAALDDSLDAR